MLLAEHPREVGPFFAKGAVDIGRFGRVGVGVINDMLIVLVLFHDDDDVVINRQVLRPGQDRSSGGTGGAPRTMPRIPKKKGTTQGTRNFFMIAFLAVSRPSPR